MRKTRNRLDEMQEQKLLRIECRGCWFAFWALLASIFIQQFLFGVGDFKQIAGEASRKLSSFSVYVAIVLIVLMIICLFHIYLVSPLPVQHSRIR